MIKKEIDVSIRKSYYWTCPWCEQFNSITSGSAEDFVHLKCAKCGAELNFIKNAKDCGKWIYEEE